MGSPRTVKVLYATHPGMDTLDFTGPLEVLAHPTYPSTLSAADGPTRIFESTVAAVSEFTTTHQKLVVKRDISIVEAYATLADYDVLIIPGGGSPGVLNGKTEPLHLIEAFAALPKKENGAIRTILSVCTGSLFLAAAGVLDGLTATTHPSYYGRLRELSEAKGKTTVVEERFVVNKVDEEKGFRVITSGGISCGLDASLWFAGHVAGKESKEKAAANLQYAYRDGIVI